MTDINVIQGETGLRLSELIVAVLSTKEAQVILLLFLIAYLIIFFLATKLFNVNVKASSVFGIILIPIALLILIYVLVINWEGLPDLIDKIFKIK